MKKIAFGIATVLVLLLGFYFYFYVFPSVGWMRMQSLLDKTIEPTATYSLVSKGWNTRVYFLVPPDAKPGWGCFISHGTGSAAGACYPTK